MRRPILLLVPVAAVALFALLAEGLIRGIGPDLAVPTDGFRFDQMGHTRQGYHQRDPELGWRLRPSSALSVTVEGGPTGIMTTNSWGFRGPEIDLAPPPDRTRIAFLGDSNPMGFALPDGAIYADGVPRILTNSFPKGGGYESVNLAVDGYSSHQARIVAERHLGEVGPEVVCIQVGFNDHTLAPVADADQSYERPALARWLEASHAYRWLRRQVLLARPTSVPDQLVPRVGLEAYAENLRAMIAAARAARAEVVLITTPARPGAPLSVSEEKMITDDGVRWTTQQDAVSRALSGSDAADTEAILRELGDAHPEWAVPVFQLAARARARGDTLTARRLETEWRARDTQRYRLQDYMARLREVARDERVPVVETRAAIEHAARSTDPRVLDAYWLDFVHLNVEGQKVLALAVATTIAERRARSGR